MPAKGVYMVTGICPDVQPIDTYMIRLSAILVLCMALSVAHAQQPLFNDTARLQPVEVLAVRASPTAPFAKTTLLKAAIEQNNLGRDLPFLLQQTPGAVANSDAGTGVGYTGIRIRGSDATRINITINGIPYNDPESQGVFFVNLPDIAASAGSIQVQRGVGTSANGTGAFGAAINLSTNERADSFYAVLSNSAGSYNTFRNTFQFGSGLMGKHFTVEGRLSRIVSDGFIDRAASNLRSAYGSLSYADAKNSVRLNVFTGQEKTYQAWYGVPEALLFTNRRFNAAGTEQPGKPYENETDNYRQTHYQFFYTRQFTPNWKWNTTLFYTKGRGYYEQYKADAKLGRYGLPDFFDGNNTVTKTDLVRRLWLDNDFYGALFSMQYKKNNNQLIGGGGYNRYNGLHYGEVIWAKVHNSIPENHQWYNVDAAKQEVSLFVKWIAQLAPRWQSFVDVQWRNIRYDINGFRDNPGIVSRNRFGFVNPRLGLTHISKGWQSYVSYALGHNEPNRNDFEAGVAERPKAEVLHDFELGTEKNTARWGAGANLYYMLYRNQLVLTGKVNDVGAYTRTNIPNSYRLGIELQGHYKLVRWLQLSGNLCLSQNRLRNFTEFIDDYDNGGQLQFQYRRSPISFSPAVVANLGLQWMPLQQLAIGLNGKYVSRQFLDNTGNKARSLRPFFVQDALLSYTLHNRLFKLTTIKVQVNNLFSRLYEPNGYTFSYFSGGQLATENYYFPMAPLNFMVGIDIKL
jgi:iron complex outermembrane recepter protein